MTISQLKIIVTHFFADFTVWSRPCHLGYRTLRRAPSTTTGRQHHWTFRKPDSTNRYYDDHETDGDDDDGDNAEDDESDGYGVDYDSDDDNDDDNNGEGNITMTATGL